MKKKKIILTAILALITALIIFGGVVVFLFLSDTSWDKGYTINEIKYVTAADGQLFRVEYEYRNFPDSEYFANVYVENREQTVGYIKLYCLYSQVNMVNPEPNLVETLNEEHLKCYVFFDDLLVYSYNNEYGFIYISEIGSASPRFYDRFVPVAKELSTNDKIDKYIRECCKRFLNNTG